MPDNTLRIFPTPFAYNTSHLSGWSGHNTDGDDNHRVPSQSELAQMREDLLRESHGGRLDENRAYEIIGSYYPGKIYLLFGQIGERIYELFQDGEKGALGSIPLDEGLIARCNDPSSPQNAKLSQTRVGDFDSIFLFNKTKVHQPRLGVLLYQGVGRAQAQLNDDDELRATLAHRVGLREAELWLMVHEHMDISTPTVPGKPSWSLQGEAWGIVSLTENYEKGSPLSMQTLDTSNTVLPVIAGPDVELETEGCTRGLAELVSLLTLTGREGMVGVVSSGSSWVFQIVERLGDQFRGRRTRVLRFSHGEAGSVIELIKQAILGTPAEFEAAVGSKGLPAR